MLAFVLVRLILLTFKEIIEINKKNATTPSQKQNFNWRRLGAEFWLLVAENSPADFL